MGAVVRVISNEEPPAQTSASTNQTSARIHSSERMSSDGRIWATTHTSENIQKWTDKALEGVAVGLKASELLEPKEC